MNGTADPADPANSADPVLVRRAQMARLAKAGKRLGYGAYLLAFVVFLVAFFTDFTKTYGTIISVSLIVGSVLLLPAIILGYGVRKATREDPVLLREHGR